MAANMRIHHLTAGHLRRYPNNTECCSFLVQPKCFINLGIGPPKGVLLCGHQTGKTLRARAVANCTDTTFICIIGSKLVQKYVNKDARMVQELCHDPTYFWTDNGRTGTCPTNHAPTTALSFLQIL